jgi:two-component system nitrate/nitrite response regulator NarL
LRLEEIGGGGTVQEERSNSERIRVTIVHEVRVVRDGLASLLRRSPEFTVVDVLPEEIVHKEKQRGSAISAADVVLAVSDWPTNRAKDEIQKIKSAFPDAKVVMIGVLGTENEILEFIEAGASGYVLPDSYLVDLVETVKAVYRGKAICSPDIIPLLFERVASLRTQLRMVQSNHLRSLTQRELEVLQLVVDGMSNKEIAAYFHLELQTVKNHVHNILEKLRVNNRREAVLCTQKEGLGVRSD